MGLWWRRVPGLPKNLSKDGLYYKGDPKALPKWIPILWRFQHKWRIIRIGRDRPYVLYFAGGGYAARFHQVIHTRFVCVRIPHSEVRFLAVDLTNDSPLPMHDMGYYGSRQGIYTDERLFMQYFSTANLAGEVTWV